MILVLWSRSGWRVRAERTPCERIRRGNSCPLETRIIVDHVLLRCGAVEAFPWRCSVRVLVKELGVQTPLAVPSSLLGDVDEYQRTKSEGDQRNNDKSGRNRRFVVPEPRDIGMSIKC